MKAANLIMLAVSAMVLSAGCTDSKSPASTNAISNTNPADINNPLVNAKRTADKTLDVSYLNQAVQLFNVQEGRYPSKLEELTPKYVAAIPDAPLGYKINYDASKGEVTVVRQ